MIRHDASAHVVLWPRHRVDEQSVIADAASREVRVYGTYPYFLKKPRRIGFRLGYSHLSEAQIREGAPRFSEVL
jgi:DNA-binding transcriptional MocR family regulator